jgi:hypothetical protein
MAAKSRFSRFPVALWRGLGSTSVRRVLVLCSMFAALMLAGFYFTSDTADGSRRMADRAAPKRGLAPNDPVARFNETHVGQLLFSSSQNDDCRRVLFDNRTGAFYEAGLVQCAQAAPSTAEVSGNDRLMAVRKAFVK